MELEETITISKLPLDPGGHCYLMVGWQQDSFELFIYASGKIWKGRFSQRRLAGFSRNLQLTEEAYLKNVKHVLKQQKDDYRYELKSGFFYWKRKMKTSVVIEGFLPVDVDNSPEFAKPDLIEVLMELNKHLKHKINNLGYRYTVLKTNYEKCLQDTEEFLNLKIDMEKALCEKFLNLMNVKKNQLEGEEKKTKEMKNNETIYADYKPAFLLK